MTNKKAIRVIKDRRARADNGEPPNRLGKDLYVFVGDGYRTCADIVSEVAKRVLEEKSSSPVQGVSMWNPAGMGSVSETDKGCRIMLALDRSKESIILDKE